MTGKWYKVSAETNSFNDIKKWCDTHLGAEGAAWRYRSSTAIAFIGSDWAYRHFYHVKIKNKKKAFAFLLTFR